ncbi:SprT-like protein [Alkalibacillus flavidus]|uniref:SprT-like protein n=1 Tax=Alkalibacillus flavidus TaxID=546021 RepID=A0ABV2KZH8_9BACI
MDQQTLEQLTNELSEQYFHKPFLDHVTFNRRLRTTGGRYIPAKRVIEINPKYVTELGEDALKGIIKHELCHYHLHIEDKPYHHRSAEFRRLLQVTGAPRFCGPLPSEATKKRVIYQCKDCRAQFERKRRMDTKRFRCGRCGGRIKEI